MNEVAQKPHSLKEALRSFAKNRVAVLSAIVVVGLIAAGAGYLLWKQHQATALPPLFSQRGFFFCGSNGVSFFPNSSLRDGKQLALSKADAPFA